MATLLTSLPTLAFPHEVDTLLISTPQSVRVVVQLGDSPMLDTTLHPDAQSRVRVEQLADFLREHITTATQVRILLDGAAAGSVRVLPCRLDVTMTAVAFCRQFFLTTSPRRKTTHPHAREVVAWRSTGTESATLTARWWTGSKMERTTQSPTTHTDATGLTTAEVSPALLTPPSPTAQLLAYALTVGERTMNFRMPPKGYAVQGVVDVEFVNAFGIRESFHFFGMVQREHKPTYTTARIGGRWKTLRVEGDELWKGTTGILARHDAELLSDLLTTREGWQRSDGAEIIIEDCDLKEEEPASTPQMAQVTWRVAKVQRGWRAPAADFTHTGRSRVFDDSFDNSFA